MGVVKLLSHVSTCDELLLLVPELWIAFMMCAKTVAKDREEFLSSQVDIGRQFSLCPSALVSC